MSRAKRYDLINNLHDPDLAEQLNPLNTAEEPGVRDPVAGQLNEDLGEFLEDAGKSVNPVDLRSAFYTKSEELTPRHVVDQEDLQHHRTGHFHVRHPMSIYSRDKRKKPKGSSKGHGSKHDHDKKKKKHRGQQYQPSMEGLRETPSASGSEEESDAESAEEPGEAVPTPVSAAPQHAEPPPGQAAPGEEPPGDVPPVIFVQPGTPLEKRAAFFLAEDDSRSSEVPSEAESGVRLQDILVNESSTDPDPGVHSVDAKRGKFSSSEEFDRKPSSQKVTFVLGENEDEPSSKSEDDRVDSGSEKKPSHHHRHHHRHHHQHGLRKATLEGRRAPGSEVALKGMDHLVPTEQDEARTLSGVDLDQMSSHRLGEARGMRRRKIASHGHAMKPSVTVTRDGIDHSPHELFVELAELHGDPNTEYEWRDTARWIKYEEDVEAEATRYGKPHVASLSFHSLLELRKVLGQGVVLMDLEGEDLPTIVTQIVDQMVIADQLGAESKGVVMRALLLRHRHVQEGGFLRRNSTAFNILGHDSHDGNLLNVGGAPNRRSSTGSSSFRNMANFFGRSSSRQDSSTTLDKENGDAGGFGGVKKIDNVNRKSSAPEIKSTEKQSKNAKDHIKIDMAESASLRSNQSDQNLQSHGDHSNILRRIPKGAEATTVLVGSVPFLDQPVMAFVRLAKGCMLGDFTEVPLPVRFLFILLGPPSDTMDYHEIGRSISTLMANTRFHDIAYRAEERRDLLNAINDFLDESIVLPPGEYDKRTLLPIMDMAKEKSKKRKQLEKAKTPPPPKDDPLKRTKRPFGGMINDIRRRYPKYWSDIKDGLNLQCLATFFFIYFACLSPAITFGGLLGEKIDGWMGVSELLIMTSIGGIIFALFAGQPLLIVGFTGPIIVFEEGLYQICGSLEIEYMPFRVWICLWVCVIALLVVCFEGSFLVSYFTRFTMEIFAALISLIFIYEVFYKLYNVFRAHPLQSYDPDPSVLPILASNLTDNVTSSVTTVSSLVINVTSGLASNVTPGLASNVTPTSVVKLQRTDEPNTALLSLILTLGTFFIAYFLKLFRNSKFLGRSARRALGDFGVPIAIAVMVGLDYAIEETYTQKLDVPDGIKPTDSDKRGWFINPLGMTRPLPVWAYFAAVLPGILAFILIFMESQITGMIISRKAKKGTGFHLDLFLMGIFSVIGGLFGLPLLTVATVRSVSHVSALSVMSSTHAPGDKPTLIEVKEQRLTGLAVHIMIGVSVLLGPVLRQVPLAVLFGVFLYMGVASMSGVQLFERVELFFMPRKHHPPVSYVKKVKLSKVHLYTVLQLICLGVLWVVKSTQAALAFPFFLVLMVPLRQQVLVRIFNEKELGHLDNEDDAPGNFDSDEDEPDFYTQAHMPM